MLTVSAAWPLFADGFSAQITSVPSPAVTNKALEVRIETQDMGSEVYCYTWCKDLNGTEKAPWTWEGVNTDKFRMSGSGGTYTLSIPDIKAFYGLTDQELTGLKKLGFIAKTKNGQQTADLVLNVEQGRTDVYGGGEGTLAAPFVLNTAAHASSMTSSIGSMSSPYQGHFDGNGHTVSNLSLSATDLGSATGLFGAIRGAEIKDLGIRNANVTGVNHVGVLAGKAESGTIERCYATGVVSGASICVGGLVGENKGATISDCYTGVRVINSDDYATGGIVGKNEGSVRNVYAAGEISGKDYVGGIAGANYGTIRNSVALNSAVKGVYEYTARFGGNDNSLNVSESNHSWNAMDNGGSDWTAHGDHASLSSASELGVFSSFKTLTGWDFDKVWEWKEENGREYPALRGIAAQSSPIDESFYGVLTGIEEIIVADNTDIHAGPNPFTDHITVTASAPIATAELYSLAGVRAAAAVCDGNESVILNTVSVPSGIYLLRATTATGSESTFKLIKQ